jgi:hypothetical protein
VLKTGIVADQETIMIFKNLCAIIPKGFTGKVVPLPHPAKLRFMQLCGLVVKIAYSDLQTEYKPHQNTNDIP